MAKQRLGSFEFECGRTIRDFTVAYETYGTFTGDNAVLICHALTGSQHVTSAGRSTLADDQYNQGRGWWNDVVGPGKAVDTNRFFVVCANVPGSCYGTDGPSTKSEDGTPWGSEFPAVTVGDWTRTQRRLLEHLDVGRLHAVIGGSVGGMNALDWARRYPEDVERVAAIATAARLDSQMLGLNAVARRAIRNDPAWQDGDYYETDSGDAPLCNNGPVQGLAIARQLGHLSYLSKASMDRKFGRRTASRDAPESPIGADTPNEFPYRDVESYLDYQGGKFADRFDANSYLALTRAMDEFDLRAGYDSDVDALAAFDGEALLVSITGDWHFTFEQAESLVRAFRASETPVTHHVIDSDHGHDAFLVEPESVGPPLSRLLAGDQQGFAPVHTCLFSG